MKRRSKSTFNALSQFLIDAWVQADPNSMSDPKRLYAEIEGKLTIKMSLNFVDTSADDPLDWHFRRIKNYRVKTRIIDVSKTFPDSRLGDMPDQSFIADAIIPHYQKVLLARSPIIDFVRTKIIGLNVGYDRIILPQKCAGKPEWCVSFTEGKFLFAGPKEPPRIDITDEHIIQLLMEGQTVKETAGVLGMSPRTVEHRVEKLKQQYDARNITHLVAKLLSAHMDRMMGDREAK